MFNNNRIINAIEKMEKQVASKNLPPEKLAQISKDLNMGFNEYARFQELKSTNVGGKLTLEEAMTVYSYLGVTLEDFNNQPIHVKAVLTQTFMELLKK